jgi:CO/xanthine dehydrogenase FAD-binding subunit
MTINAHPGLPEFDYILPTSFAEASQFLTEHDGEGRPLLGGTDIFVRMRDGFWKDKYLVDIKGLDGTEDISFDPDDGLTIGAAINMNRVSAFASVKENYNVLAQAVDSVASYQLRTRATIVGNICNASPAGDTIGACMLLDGVLKVHGIDGIRQEPLSTFFLGPGESILRVGDIVSSIHIPIQVKGMVGKYIKLGRNKSSDLSIVGVTALGYPDSSSLSGYRMKLALASVAPVPLVVDQVEDILSAGPINETLLEEAAQMAMDTSNPIDDVRASAQYRRYMVRNLSRKALSMVWKELELTQ